MSHDLKTLQSNAKKILESIDPSQLKAKDRLAIPLQDMPAQDPEVRVHNMNEVATGYTREQAMVEALRCLQCKTAPWIIGCPVAIDIPRFIETAAEGDFAGSIAVIKESSLLPAICGRVCPQESQCQLYGTVGKSLKDVEKSVSIGRIERYAADFERESGAAEMPKVAPSTGKKVAVIGSGPAGITAAADMRKKGHAVVVFEAFQKPGGVMIYGIPE
ncbi:MAG: NAD(P)-binding protein, partial [Spirochaetales bacterium]|nr:NAD(P)-binding protein [Spirochaetales bacterium]